MGRRKSTTATLETVQAAVEPLGQAQDNVPRGLTDAGSAVRDAEQQISQLRCRARRRARRAARKASAQAAGARATATERAKGSRKAVKAYAAGATTGARVGT